MGGNEVLEVIRRGMGTNGREPLLRSVKMISLRRHLNSIALHPCWGNLQLNQYEYEQRL